MMTNDRQIVITVGASRQSIDWRPQLLTVSELWERLKTPARGTETQADYLAMPKARQDQLKDVGGYVAGQLNGTRRKASAVTSRDVITLDLDNIPPYSAESVLEAVGALGCGYCVYSTRKHTAARPRLRVLLPLDRSCTADEYEPIARKVCEKLGMELADPTTFEAHRLMYWPSVCADGEYIYQTADRPMLRADAVLSAYTDWRDISSWPLVPGTPSVTRAAAKQGDPLQKSGIVGAFCKVYDVPAAMAAFLPGVYAETDTPGRYTFCEGSTAGGAVLYDDGKFLYSHHATDPCSGKLVNAFDLVRLHKFEELDDDADPSCPVSRLPSYKAMKELAREDKQVSGLLLEERYAAAGETFKPAEEDENWLAGLTTNGSGVIQATVANVWTILEHDDQLKGKFALNSFTGRGEVFTALPWNALSKRRPWSDSDNAGIYWYLEKFYNIYSTGKVDSALALHAQQHAFNDVQDYLLGLTWDGVPRLDTLFIDGLGVPDTPYARTVTRKSLVAAVARALNPGVKYDQMLIVIGEQGLGKSVTLQRLGRSDKGWFTDNLRTFEGKEASELISGVWIVEVGELDAFRKTENSRIKQFISQTADRYRAAYGRHVTEKPRCCAFFGTTNREDFLTDRTGNRRYWVLQGDKAAQKWKPWEYLTPDMVGQIWAEAVVCWKWGEDLYLPPELKDVQQQVEEEHREVDANEGVILEWMKKPVPEDWIRWELPRRKMFWQGAISDAVQLVPRDRICAAEVWCELLGGDMKNARRQDIIAINDILRSATKQHGQRIRFGEYGIQRGFWLR